MHMQIRTAALQGDWLSHSDDTNALKTFENTTKQQINSSITLYCHIYTIRMPSR